MFMVFLGLVSIHTLLNDLVFLRGDFALMAEIHGCYYGGRKWQRSKKKKKNEKWKETLIPWIKHAAEQNGRSYSRRYISVAVWSGQRKGADGTVLSIILHRWGRERERNRQGSWCGIFVTTSFHKTPFTTLFLQPHKLVKWYQCKPYIHLRDTHTHSYSLSMGLLDRAEKVRYMT